MSILMGRLPHRRHSRRRTRSLRARLLFAAMVVAVGAGIAWQPFSSPQSPASARIDAARLAAIAPQAEPEQSIDTEGALADPDPRADAVRYVADR